MWELKEMIRPTGLLKPRLLRIDSEVGKMTDKTVVAYIHEEVHRQQP